MTNTLRNLEITSWILALAAPLLCTWIPSAVFLGKPAGDTLALALMYTLFPASPFFVLASLIHTEKRNAKTNAVTVGVYSSLTATVMSTLLFYICFWRSILTSIGVNSGAIFAFILSPLIFVVTLVAYGIGKGYAKEK